MKHPEIPALAYRLFKWFCKDTLFEELEGDLEETFLRNKEKFGLKKARKIYTREVLKMIRPTVVRKSTSGPVYRLALVSNYTRVAFRNLSRNKLFSTINMVGLAMSMAIGLLAIAFSSEMYQYDKFHEKGDRIYRINNTRTNINQSPTPYATTSLLTARRLNDFGGFEKIVPIFNGFYGDLVVEEKVFDMSGLYAGADFFDVFTFPLSFGNAETALSEPYSVVITEELAEKIFSRTNVIGETLENRDKQYTITGVLANPPTTSHIKFDAIASLKTVELDEGYDYIFTSWGTMWSSYVYVLLPEDHDLDQIYKNLSVLALEENANHDRFEISLSMESLHSIFPGDGKYNQMRTVMPAKNVRRIIVLAIIVIFSACFNYTNLSLARSLKRAKEVGIRKVVGATKDQLFSQFILESVLISLIALAGGFLLFLLIKPEFLTLDPYITRTTSLTLTPQINLLFLALAVITGIVAGFLPSLIMTRFNPSRILKGINKMKVRKGIGLREVMTGIQFMFSMGFVILVTLSYRQYAYATNFDLGFETENILNVELQGNDRDVLVAGFEALPEVQGISSSAFILSIGTTNSDDAKLPGALDSITCYSMSIDDDYLENMEHELLAGNNFRSAEEDEIIVNEQFVKAFQLGSPGEALGTRVKFYEKTRTVTGVVKDFHYGTVSNPLRPFVFLAGTQRPYYLNLRVKSQDMVKTMEKLDEVWSSVDPNHQFKAEFYSDQIASAYTDLASTMKTFGLLAVVAISISVLGLLGMAVYTTESRMKELTIRKVLGASASAIVVLLSKNFIRIFIVASLIAIPLSYYLFEKTIIEHMEYTIEPGLLELGGGAIAIILIALVTITSQTLRAAKTNPATNLRNE